jgi:hypothetical protein
MAPAVKPAQRLLVCAAVRPKRMGNTHPSGEGTGEPEVLRLSRNGWIPNNERLPVLLIVQRFPCPAPTQSRILKKSFCAGWPPQWR